jgi:hypothetical protein
MSTAISYRRKYHIVWKVFIPRITSMMLLCMTVVMLIRLNHQVSSETQISDISAGMSGESAQIFVIAPGDSLWSIAGDIASSNRDRRHIVEDIISINGLNTPVLKPGTALRVPSYIDTQMAKTQLCNVSSMSNES